MGCSWSPGLRYVTSGVADGKGGCGAGGIALGRLEGVARGCVDGGVDCLVEGMKIAWGYWSFFYLVFGFRRLVELRG